MPLTPSRCRGVTWRGDARRGYRVTNGEGKVFRDRCTRVMCLGMCDIFSKSSAAPGYLEARDLSGKVVSWPDTQISISEKEEMGSLVDHLREMNFNEATTPRSKLGD